MHGRPAASASDGYPQRPREPADVADVGLHDVDGSGLDHRPPDARVPVLLPARHVELQRVRHLACPLELPVRARLLEVGDAVLLEHPADLDRLGRRVAAVGVDEQRDVVAERAAHRRDHRLGASGPLVLVVAALLADSDLEGIEAVALA